MSSGKVEEVVAELDPGATPAPAVHTQADTRQQSSAAGRALTKGAVVFIYLS
jgi:hypothetical protein